MSKKARIYQEYCTGCGLCHSVNDVKFICDDKGFHIPQLEEKDVCFCEDVCPAGGKSFSLMDCSKIWGRNQAVYLGWSSDSTVRKKASSGGVITSLASFLLSEKIVDAVIQTTADNKIPWKTSMHISETKEEVITCSGSRYAESAPLMNLLQSIDFNKKYAFIGKPCDCVALKNLFSKQQSLQYTIIYVFSFFCAGTPSEHANKELVLKMGATECSTVRLDYRGNGWPGFVTVTDSSGEKHQMTYVESWGKILGRDIRKSCRFCVDGVGEAADISCGDAWYLKSDNKPDFSEAEGRNVIFARSEKGYDLLKKAAEAGVIYIREFENINQLQHIQKYQMERRATMLPKIAALKITLKPTPKYPFRQMRSWKQYATKKQILRIFIGTIKRRINGKI